MCSITASMLVTLHGVAGDLHALSMALVRDLSAGHVPTGSEQVLSSEAGADRAPSCGRPGVVPQRASSSAAALGGLVECVRQLQACVRDKLAQGSGTISDAPPRHLVSRLHDTQLQLRFQPGLVE